MKVYKVILKNGKSILKTGRNAQEVRNELEKKNVKVLAVISAEVSTDDL